MVSAVCPKGEDRRRSSARRDCARGEGQVNADVGGDVIKQRIARPGQGKSGGYRTIIFFKCGTRAVFVYGFAKSERANIHADEEKQLTDKQITSLWRKTEMSKQYRSDAMGAIHETMEALHRVGAVNKQTMRKFDDACLTPVRPLSPKRIKALRQREHVSQTVFANYLNVMPNLVSKWERGEKRPSAPALKLLSLVEKHGLAAVA